MPKAAGGGSAGAAANPYGLTQPPSGSYDPALEAQRRASHRGLEDLEQDTRRGEHFAERDLEHALRGIHINTARHRFDLNRQFGRGVTKLANQESDTKKDAGRQEEDFHTRLADIGRQFAELGQRQGEGSNAAGVNDAGTAAASAAARGRNQTLAEAPIHTAEGRLHEDLLTALDRIAQSHGYLEQDLATSTKRLNTDRDISRAEAHRETDRKLLGYDTELERGKREATITDADLLEEEIYGARQNHPGAFNNQGERNGQTGGGGSKPNNRPAVGAGQPAKGRRRR